MIIIIITVFSYTSVFILVYIYTFFFWKLKSSKRYELAFFFLGLYDEYNLINLTKNYNNKTTKYLNIAHSETLSAGNEKKHI